MTVHVRQIDAGMIRATRLTRSTPASWPDLTQTTPQHVTAWRDWLREVWADTELAQAIEAASPDLARTVGDICDGAAIEPKRIRRATESVLRYVLRARSRATPFGYFAGVAPLQVGVATQTVWHDDPTVCARPDSAWLAELVARLEAAPETRRHLPVVANDLAYVRADRLVLPCQPRDDGTKPGTLADATIRHTPAVAAAMRAAHTPITIADLAHAVAAESPTYQPAQVEAMLAQLLERRFLLSPLTAPMDVTDPLGHLIDQLAALPVAIVPAATLAALRAIDEDLRQLHRAQDVPAQRAAHSSATAAMTTLADRPAAALAIDARLPADITIPAAVAAEAEAAAAALIRLSPYPTGNPAWRDWHERFLERFGLGAVIPVRIAVSPDAGLDYPASYRGSAATAPARPLGDRDRRLLALAQHAALERRTEIVLDDAAITALETVDGPRAPHPAPHTELRFTVHAPTPAALDAGHFTLSVVSAARQAGTTLGRFLHVFDPADRDHMTKALAGLTPLAPDALLAQMSIPPLAPRAVNLARAHPVFPPITVSEYRADLGDAISIDDLAVAADVSRLWLVRMSDGRVVEPVMVNAVEFKRGAHPLARFLAEITNARASSCVPFNWGAADGLPFLPAVRHGRTILRPATWHLTAAELPGPRADWAAWERAFAAVRQARSVPASVFLGDTDVRMGLDLDCRAHLALLRGQLDRAGAARLTQGPGPADYGWIDSRAHEVVLPMAVTGTNGQPHSRPSGTGPVRSTFHPGHTPGASPWLYACLFGNPERQARILTAHLPELLADWDHGPADGWWFLCYRKPEPHLRLRLPLHDADAYGAAARRFGRWADRLRDAGLIRRTTLDTYHPETGRYGTGATLSAAEAVFAADSASAVAQLAAATDTASVRALVAASLTDIACTFTGGTDAGMRWLVDHVDQHPAPHIDRALLTTALYLADPTGDYAAVRQLDDGAQLAAAWERRRAAVTAYRHRLDTDQTADPDAVLAALLHLHHVRMSGIDRTGERLVLRLARTAALRWTHSGGTR